MLIDLVIAVVVVCGLLLYSTISIATFRFLEHRRDGAEVSLVSAISMALVVLATYGTWLGHAVATTNFGQGTAADCCGTIFGGIVVLVAVVGILATWETSTSFMSLCQSILWPLALLFSAMSVLCLGVAKGPVAWGNMLGDLSTHHSQRKRDMAGRIAELEAELELDRV